MYPSIQGKEAKGNSERLCLLTKSISYGKTFILIQQRVHTTHNHVMRKLQSFTLYTHAPSNRYQKI